MVKFSEFKDAVNDLPTKDGDYTVVRFNKAKECFSVTGVHYTVKYGWNTFEESTDHGFDYVSDVESGYTVLWAEMPTLEEAKNEIANLS